MLLNSERLRRKTFPHWAPLAAMGVEGYRMFRFEDFGLKGFLRILVFRGLRDVQDSSYAFWVLPVSWS